MSFSLPMPANHNAAAVDGRAAICAANRPVGRSAISCRHHPLTENYRPVGILAAMATKGERTREKLLATAESLVLERGFAATSLDDILSATGFTKGAFFHHFKGKADLARALVERYRKNHARLFERLVAEADAQHGDPLDATVHLLSRFEAFIEARSRPLPGCVFAAGTHEGGQFDTALRDLIADSLKRWAALYEGKFDAVLACYEPRIPISAKELAEMIVAIIEGGLILSRSYGDAHLVARQSRQFRNYLELIFADREPRPAALG
jgi:TetR/AcrR family transcriptional repressor of nem operon